MATRDLIEPMDETLRAMFIGVLNRDPLALTKAARVVGAIRVTKERFPNPASILLFNQLLEDADKVFETGDQVKAAKNGQKWERFLALSKQKRSTLGRFLGLARRRVGRFQPQRIPRRGERIDSSRWPLSQLQTYVSPRLWQCAKCARYFLAGDRKRRLYCSRKCAGNTTAKAANRKRRAAETKEKLERAARATQAWDRTVDWKAWIAAKTGLTPKFITQATNRGDLKAPTKRVYVTPCAQKIPHKKKGVRNSAL
jgi:hypothetical protein